MPDPCDAMGRVIPKVGPVGVGSIVDVPFTVTAVGATSNGSPLLTLVSKYPTPAGDETYITVSTLYSTQTVLDQ